MSVIGRKAASILNKKQVKDTILKINKKCKKFKTLTKDVGSIRQHQTYCDFNQNWQLYSIAQNDQKSKEHLISMNLKILLIQRESP